MQCGVVYSGTVINTDNVNGGSSKREAVEQDGMLTERATEPNPAACQTLCDHTTGCVAFNYIQPNCTLLSSVSGHTYQPGAVGGSQVAPGAPAPSAIPASPACPGSAGKTYTDGSGTSYNIVCYTDYSGNSLGQPFAASVFGNCFSTCDTTSGCTGVVYNTYTALCTLKSAFSGVQTGNTSLIAAVRIGGPPAYAVYSSSTLVSSSSSSGASVSTNGQITTSTMTTTLAASPSVTATLCKSCIAHHL